MYLFNLRFYQASWQRSNDLIEKQGQENVLLSIFSDRKSHYTGFISQNYSLTDNLLLFTLKCKLCCMTQWYQSHATLFQFYAGQKAPTSDFEQFSMF